MTNQARQFVLRPVTDDSQPRRWLDQYLWTQRDKVVTVTVEEGEPRKRSLSANALQAAWIREIASWQGDSEHNVRLWVKAKIALPVLVQNTETEAEKIRAKRVMWTLEKIGYFEMSDDQKLKVMDLIEVTSAMTSRQHKAFREQMQAHYGNMGLVLEVR